MSLSTAMYSGLSGLNSHGEAMGVVGDNIANLNTTGFKYSAVHFEDLLAQMVSTGSGPGQVGRGSRISQINTVWQQGSLETSADDVDVAITGIGFLIVKDPLTNGLYYTRDGNFSLDKDGYLINAHGYRVQGKAIDPATGTPAGVDTDINITQNYSAPRATTEVEMVLNLDANAAVGDTYASALSLYDGLGNIHTLNVVNTKAGANDWRVSGTLDGIDITALIADQGGGGPSDLIFNANGTMVSGGLYTIDLSAYNIGNVALNLRNTSGGNTTQYAASSVTNYASQDGYGPGFLQRLSINNEGIITGHYSNGQVLPHYQLTLARFNAPGKLFREGSNLYTETQDSGVALTGAPGTNGLGKINSNSLEQSNVDLSNEFVHMILYQRAFQANSRIITTTDSMMEEVLSLKR
jgi:flagellar hook protein FlgE|uniref:Flagellar hook protein FlgE n=1 Tax=Desulfobacca acetoxidans TaxID=60893 RepID=A0A7C3WQ80_9BACT